MFASFKRILRDAMPAAMWRAFRAVVGKILAADFPLLLNQYPPLLLRSQPFRDFVISRNSMWRTDLSRSIAGRFSGCLERLGSDYGGWKVPVDLLGPNPIVYSLGVGTDVTFDLAVIDRCGAEVFAFDPTPAAIRHVEKVASGMEKFRFLPLGIWSEDTEIKFFAPRRAEEDVSHSAVNLQGTQDFFMAKVITLRSAIKMLGHHLIDYLKMDIEGAQFEVLKSALRDRVPFRILGVEIDQPSMLSRAVDLLKRLDAAGYELIDIDGWNFLFIARRNLEEKILRHASSATAD
jgi:FkbM family methyltransferase